MLKVTSLEVKTIKFENKFENPMIMGSLANGSERFTGMWGAHQRTVQNGSLVANYLELFGTMWFGRCFYERTVLNGSLTFLRTIWN